jgi:hypothetical protein
MRSQFSCINSPSFISNSLAETQPMTKLPLLRFSSSGEEGWERKGTEKGDKAALPILRKPGPSVWKLSLS